MPKLSKTTEPIFENPLKDALRAERDSRKHAETLAEILLKREREIETLLENAPDVISRFDKKLRFVYANPAIEKTSGLFPHMLIGKTIRELKLSKEATLFWEKTLRKVFVTGKKKVIEKEFENYKGLRYFRTYIIPEKSNNDKVDSVIMIAHDITQEKLEEKRRDDFVSMASHELKTPLASIKAFIQMIQLKTGKGDYDRLPEYLFKMEKRVDSITQLINDFMDINRIKSGKFIYVDSEINFTRLVEETIEEIQSTNTKHKIIINSQTETKMLADKNRIKQILINLLSNAIKYSPESDKIIVNLKSNKKETIFSVKDFGIGVPEEKIRKIFEPFYQVSQIGNGDGEGLGLGLYITSQIVRHYGGKVMVDNNRDGGATFTVYLPKIYQIITNTG